MGKDADKKLKVLLVDDVGFYREVMGDYLQRTPARILNAGSAEEALKISLEEEPDLIFMDVGLPGLNGIRCCQEMKSHERLARVPLVLIFTPGRDAEVEDVADSGCDGYLTKPFGREDFLNLGHRFLFPIERREPRYSCQMTVEFVIAGRSFRGRGHDLSPNGVYIEFREELPPENRIELSFLLPTISATPFKAAGRMAWVNQGFPRHNLTLPQGFGVYFTRVDDPSVECLKKYLQSISASNRPSS